MIVSGNYGGDTAAYKVFAGTQNWINGALRQSDENTLEIKGKSVYADYSSEFQSIKKYAWHIA